MYYNYCIRKSNITHKEESFMEERKDTITTQNVLVNRNGKQYLFPVPRYRNKHRMLKNPKKSVFVFLQADYISWLFDLRNLVVANSSENSVFQKKTIDKFSPGISAFRICNTQKAGDFSQVQVFHRNPDFNLLAYFQSSRDLQPHFIILYDVNCPKNSTIIWGNTTDSDLKTKRYLVKIYQALIIYLRPWDYSCGQKLCTVFPFPLL